MTERNDISRGGNPLPPEDGAGGQQPLSRAPVLPGVRQRLHNSLSVQSKFLLGTGFFVLLNCLVTALIIYNYEKNRLEEVAFAKSELVMAAVDASRAYVRDELRPMMSLYVDDDQFVPEAMSTSYVGRAVMERFAPATGDFNYRRVAVNARNPAYEANQLEREMLAYFAENPEQTEWLGLVRVDGQERFKRFRPDYFQAECLQCHGRPEQAPETMVQMYGNSRGFGRSAGEPGGLVAVGVAVDTALAQARENAISIFLVVFVGMALVFMALSFVFHRVVVTNLRNLLEIFQDNEAPAGRGDWPPADAQAEISGLKPWNEVTGSRNSVFQRDELVELTEAACNMASHLRQTREQLRRYARELESRVEERTQALQLSEAKLREKEMAEKIRHTEKMVAMGQMMAGLAHEINNPLGVMLCYLDLIKRQAVGDPQVLRDLEIIEKQTRGCKRIVDDLLAFARGGESRKEPNDLNRLISEVAGMVAPQFSKQGVEVRLDLAPDLPSLSLDGNKIKQVFLNLLMNARQAMPESGGWIEITSVQESDSDRVQVQVRDSGGGIAAVNLDRIFEPFFSTKATGEGTGLGLAVSYGIIKEHGGEITVESGEGDGACFTLRLPRTQGADSPEKGGDLLASGARQTTEGKKS